MRKLVLLSILLFPALLFPQTIAEKRLGLQSSSVRIEGEVDKDLALVNELLEEKHRLLKALYEKGRTLYAENANPECYRALSKEIEEVREEIHEIEAMWRDGKTSSESYDLWHQPDATLLQLVIDYGSFEGIYLVPPEIAAIKVSLSSSLPVPKESWNDCLKIILEKNGVGIRELNPYLRELYFYTRDTSHIQAILTKREEVELFPASSRLLYILQPTAPDPSYTLNFLRKFSNPAITTFEVVHGDILIFSTQNALRELLKLYDCLSKGQEAEYKMVSLSKMEGKEIIAILEAAFPPGGDENLRIISLDSLPRSLFLFGSASQLEKVEKLIRDIESKIEDGAAKVLFWYTAKHTEASDLAAVLAKVYDALIESGATTDEKQPCRSIAEVAAKVKEGMTVNPPKVEPKSAFPKEMRESHKTKDGKNNFIVDPKSGSIIMVVEQDSLPKIKELLKKLDQPKRMVQIEVLLFEKRLNRSNKSGLNLLRLGTGAAADVAKIGAGLSWGGSAMGILEFMISNKKQGWMPAYDLNFQFLLGQEDIQINASPSIMTVNQTPASIHIVDETSICNGMEEDKDGKKKGTYTRVQYGINMKITPTINCDEESADGTSFVTLETEINFDSNQKNKDDRPDVTRRQINNLVRVADGESVILGGLRKKSSNDKSDAIPFLGEIPGIGKLFSTTSLQDDSTEMFVFITPKIVRDPIADAQRIRNETLKKRPGDIPEFLAELEEARAREKKRLFEGGLTALFGRKETKKEARQGEYEGK